MTAYVIIVKERNKLGIKQQYTIKPIAFDECKEWLLYKHYAHRMCPISFSFGLFDENNVIIGCCVFGGSANRNNVKIGEFGIIELNRLVVNEGLEKNVLSYFVSQCLKSLPPPLIVLSYADPNKGHHGYIYQATNWFYLGQGQRKDGGWDSGVTSFIKDDREYHGKTVSSLIGSASKSEAEKNGFTRLFSKPKHKYIYLLGTKKDKLKMLQSIPYRVFPYPKGDNIRYDASHTISAQSVLF
jgi:hypothetical protein